MCFFYIQLLWPPLLSSPPFASYIFLVCLAYKFWRMGAIGVERVYHATSSSSRSSTVYIYSLPSCFMIAQLPKNGGELYIFLFFSVYSFFAPEENIVDGSASLPAFIIKMQKIRPFDKWRELLKIASNIPEDLFPFANSSQRLLPSLPTLKSRINRPWLSFTSQTDIEQKYISFLYGHWKLERLFHSFGDGEYS